MRKLVLFVLVLACMPFISFDAFAHCQIPCGIYGDHMRIDMIEEDIRTIEKSMREILKLSKVGDKNYNQLVRWITNKDMHATKIQDTVNEYFLAQRIKSVNAGDKAYSTYVKELTLLHGMIVYAMKCKQTTDPGNATMLRKLLKDFEGVYFKKQ